MEKYIKAIADGYYGYWNYFIGEILNPSWHNYFYWLVGASLVIYGLEILFPWRKNQPLIREHFWLDIFYLFWNYFLFALVAYNALSMVAVEAFNDFLGLFGITNTVAIKVDQLPGWLQLVILFIVRDFMQWAIHRMYHHVGWMWEFHKVHHSTREMGFAALLRYHWMENILYRTLEYIPLAMIGFGITDFFIVHIFTLVLGQLGHANLNIPLGPFKYIINGPQMHLWHHARELPESHPHGFNYGISLSLWDFLFRTNYWPSDDEHLPVGLPDEDKFPEDFVGQTTEPFKRIFTRSKP
ncbi:sterol desaturase family protein [Algoriphagus winogradskyi]|uniref:Sterol desaturase/sphingolipid hydroxylase, fatty acid hydroxylase superfamily n=1 Tax=Algoriphagus winogradskyi TaxID=237017 RepID=A0ABY1P8C7_9BACT|nr:sterol desaturase family protein [Algoriphagus winogradskyi]SMP28798.1 Sterol desaturase/sphingolipid hydroxylase, fatty acid hydroxylase superfamily [Algoriphagus winogradskyi]